MALRLSPRPSDPFRDFCQWDYAPARPPAPGDLRQAALLDAVLKANPETRPTLDLLRRIQDFRGLFDTVWGLKSAAGRLELELYFYDYARAGRRLPMTSFVAAFPDLFAPDFTVPDALDYFMASVELPLEAGAPPVAQVDLYTDGSGGTISAGVCHAWDGHSLRRKNLYRFYQSERDRAALLDDLGNRALPGFVRPGLWNEQIYVVAPKAQSEAVYLSRLEIDPSLALAQEAGLDARILAPLRTLRAPLSRHLFDIGIDVGPGCRITKVGIYGLM